jgi:NADPH-dependent ferric siderophore reductase
LAIATQNPSGYDRPKNLDELMQVLLHRPMKGDPQMDQNLTQPSNQNEPAASIFTRHKFEIKRRILTITGKDYVTPKMIRITATGEDLADFNSMAPDDHLKLVIDLGTDKPEMRDYTPRSFDAEKRIITVDFAIHEAGPATQWAIQAKVGDEMRIGGPRGSSQLTEKFDWLLLIGDETALPAIGRWAEELNSTDQLISLGIVTDAAEEQQWQTKAQHNAFWAHRPSSEDTSGAGAIATLSQIERPKGKGFIWIAAEAKAAREIKAFVLENWAHPAQFVKSSGYWVKGMADTTDK